MNDLGPTILGWMAYGFVLAAVITNAWPGKRASLFQFHCWAIASGFAAAAAVVWAFYHVRFI